MMPIPAYPRAASQHIGSSFVCVLFVPSLLVVAVSTGDGGGCVLVIQLLGDLCCTRTHARKESIKVKGRGQQAPSGDIHI